MKYIILCFAIFLFVQASAQVSYDGYVSGGYSVLYGYNYDWGKLMKAWWSYDEVNGFWVTKLSYGYNQVKNYKWKIPADLCGNFGFGVYYRNIKFSFSFSAFSHFQGLREEFLNDKVQNVIYYLNLWDSNLFPLIYTDNIVNYVGPVEIAGERAVEVGMFGVGIESERLFFESKLFVFDEYEKIGFYARAKYFDIFSNNVSIEDRFEAQRNLYIFLAGIKNSYRYKLFYINYKLGAGFGLNRMKFRNEWIDIDSIKYAPFGKENSEVLDILYRGNLYFGGNVLVPNVTFSGDLEIGFKPKTNISLTSSLNFLVIPNYLVRYKIYYPWGIGLEGVNATTGLVWNQQKSDVVIVRWNIIKITVNL